MILSRSVAAAFLASCLAAGAASAADRIPVRVVVITTFEIGNDAGDAPGEFQNWVERFPLPQHVPFPQGYRDLRYNADKQVLGIVTGEGGLHAAASIMALGLDPRFDLSHAYWVLAGIAGIDPAAGSVGSAAWAKYAVDGDLAYEIDAREIPSDWSTGYVPLGRDAPYKRPAPAASTINGTSVYTLNAGLVDWAYALTRSVMLPDDTNLQKVRAPYTDQPVARKPPFVLEGDTLSASTFWVGARMNAWAEGWVKYWTNGAATFATTAEEDTGVMQAITFLAQVHRADPRRVLLLRTASDYSVPPPGETAAQLLASDNDGGLSGFTESLNAAYLVGSKVVNELSRGWSRYDATIPGVPQ